MELLFGWINDRELVASSAAYHPSHEADHREWFDAIRNRDDVVIFAIRELASERRRLVGTSSCSGSIASTARASDPDRGGVDHGHGLGTDAVTLLLRHAFDDLDLRRVQLQVFAHNERAIRCYENAGFQREGTLRAYAYVDGSPRDVVLMGALRHER